jgi:Flp pilus assembly protein TadG
MHNSPTNLKHLQRRMTRRGVAMSLELVMVLPILLLVLVAIVEFTLLLTATQAINSAADAAAREAALASSTKASIEAAVNRTLDGYLWKTKASTMIYVNKIKDTTGTLTASAITGDAIQVTVNVPAHATAPDVLSIVKVSLGTKDLSSSFVTRRE